MADPSLSQASKPRREPSFPRISQAQLGLYIALGSLTMLFGASLVGYLVTRAQSEVWRGADMPPLPHGLLLSTVVLVGVSVGMRWAKQAVSRNAFSTLQRALWLTAGLAAIFLFAQIQNWRSMAAATLPEATKTLYAFTFYMLTVLHALHVVAGLVPLGIVLLRARQKQYTSSRYEGVHLCAQYWDFLLIVWVVLLGTMYVAS
jgi:cytochrome c oxidase subunit 3